MDIKRTFVVAITGASGALYGIRMLKAMLEHPFQVHLILSDAGKQVLTHETGLRVSTSKVLCQQHQFKLHGAAKLQLYGQQELFAPPASGSFRHDGMVVAPCSMKTLGAIAGGLANNLIHRAADVCLKEKRPLVLLARETPLSTIHLRNMLKAATAGATIMPPAPGFYFRPQSILDLVDSIVARALDHLHIEHELSRRWGEKDGV